MVVPLASPEQALHKNFCEGGIKEFQVNWYKTFSKLSLIKIIFLSTGLFYFGIASNYIYRDRGY